MKKIGEAQKIFRQEHKHRKKHTAKTHRQKHRNTDSRHRVMTRTALRPQPGKLCRHRQRKDTEKLQTDTNTHRQTETHRQ